MSPFGRERPELALKFPTPQEREAYLPDVSIKRYDYQRLNYETQKIDQNRQQFSNFNPYVTKKGKLVPNRI